MRAMDDFGGRLAAKAEKALAIWVGGVTSHAEDASILGLYYHATHSRMAPHATHGLDRPMVVFCGDGSSSLDGLPRRL